MSFPNLSSGIVTRIPLHFIDERQNHLNVREPVGWLDSILSSISICKRHVIGEIEVDSNDNFWTETDLNTHGC